MYKHQDPVSVIHIPDPQHCLDPPLTSHPPTQPEDYDTTVSRSLSSLCLACTDMTMLADRRPESGPIRIKGPGEWVSPGYDP